MNLNNSNLLSYCGFATLGVAGFAYFVNNNVDFALFAGGLSLVCIYGAFASAKNELKDIQSAQNSDLIWDNISSIEHEIYSCARKYELDNVKETINSSTNNEFEIIHRYFDSKTAEISRRVDALENSSVCETACVSNKRCK